MFIITLFLLLVPGVISLRILWRGKSVSRSDVKFLVADYLIYSFLILLVTYAFMFFSYADRTVTFSTSIYAVSTILSAAFVFKYSIVALITSLILPAFVPWICRSFLRLEEKRKIRLEEEKKDS